MQFTTSSLTAEPCDDEYDNMANLSCLAENGYWFALSRFPDEEQVQITTEDSEVSLNGLTITLKPGSLMVTFSPEAAKLLPKGHDHYEVIHKTSERDMPEVLETLRLILEGTGMLVNEL